MGLGIGVIVAAVIMGIAMRGRTREMTDEEIKARQFAKESKEQNAKKDDKNAPNQQSQRDDRKKGEKAPEIGGELALYVFHGLT